MCVVAISVWVLVRRDFPTIDVRPERSFGNLISLIVFTLCVGSAVWLRKKSAAHKRLMLIGSMIIIAPALDRMSLLPGLSEFIDAILPDALGPPEIVFATLGTLSLFLIVMIHDLLTRKRPHWATIFGILCLFIIGPAISAAITKSGMWSAFVRWVG